MTKAQVQDALDLYTRVRQETTPEALDAFQAQDLITLVAATGLPWSVCSKLTQYARCRYWAARYTQARKMRQARQERRLMVSHARYFAGLARWREAGSQLQGE